ncbi:hypothetical protein [Nonomuraea sp. NPDC003201]
MTGTEVLPKHKCPTCKTKGRCTLDQATQQVTCGECGQSSLVLIAPEPQPVKRARRPRASSRRKAQ